MPDSVWFVVHHREAVTAYGRRWLDVKLVTIEEVMSMQVSAMLKCLSEIYRMALSIPREVMVLGVV